MRKAHRRYPDFTVTEEDDVRVLFFYKKYSDMLAWVDIDTDDYKYIFYFNYDEIIEDFLKMYYDIIPHEVAHLVYHTMIPEKKQARIQHNKEWKEIAMSLGSSGEVDA